LKERIILEQKGITGIETAIILIAFVVVASVFAYSVLSAGLFSTQKSQEAIYSSLQEVQGTLEVRGSVIGYKDSLNAAENGSLGRLDITVTGFSDSTQIDLTPAYTLAPGTGALTLSNAGGNRLQIAFNDQDASVTDCAWTVAFIGMNNADNILESAEKAVISVWLHSYDGAVWGPPAGEGAHFLGTHYVDTYHRFTLEVKAAHGAILTIERTTPAYLDNVNDLH
jgi:archaeal flagellin FlaB